MGSSRRDYAVMLSAVKLLDTQRDRPFAAAQGDTCEAASVDAFWGR
jgi:hypothetical protein